MSANIGKPSALDSSTSTIANAGIVRTQTTSVPAVAAIAGRSIVARRAVTRVPRIAAVGPLGQSPKIQNALMETSANAARSPAHSAPTWSLETEKRMDPADGGAGDKNRSYASAQ